MNKKLLMVLAGWAITRSDIPSYRKLMEAIGEIIPTLTGDEPQILPSKPALPDELPVAMPVDLDPGLAQGYTVVVPTEGCKHKFNILNQRCIHCGRSYLEIRSRKPECF
jgi:hypothetical protein